MGGDFCRRPPAWLPASETCGIACSHLAKISAQGQHDDRWGVRSPSADLGIDQRHVFALYTEGDQLIAGGVLGTHPSTGANDTGIYNYFLFGGLAVNPVNPNQQGLSGAWGRSNTPGTRQAFLFDFYPDNVAPGHGTAFAGWYTYDVAGGGGGQRWYALQGDVYSDNSIASLGIYTATDGNLNAGTKPPIVRVGTATVSFSNCSTGMLAYAFDDGRTGYIPLSRVGQNTACGDNHSPPANTLLSGAWSTPDAVGMGFVIDIIPSQTTLFGSWYTFFAAGSSAPSPRQQWFVFQDSNFGSTATSSNDIDLLQSSGGTFDATVGGGVTTTTVGKVSLSFQSCTAATLTYSIPSQSVSQTTVSLVRLGPAPAGCAL